VRIKTKSFYDEMTNEWQMEISEVSNKKSPARTLVGIGTVAQSGTYPVPWVPDLRNSTVWLLIVVLALYLWKHLKGSVPCLLCM
jgi:hypothetical protein